MDRTPPPLAPWSSDDQVRESRDERSRVALRRASALHCVRAQPVAGLARLVEDSIVPALVRGQRTAPEPPEPGPGRMRPTAVDVSEFARISLCGPRGKLRTYVEDLRDRGVSLEALYLDLLAPAARRPWGHVAERPV